MLALPEGVVPDDAIDAAIAHAYELERERAAWLDLLARDVRAMLREELSAVLSSRKPIKSTRPKAPRKAPDSYEVSDLDMAAADRVARSLGLHVVRGAK